MQTESIINSERRKFFQTSGIGLAGIALAASGGLSLMASGCAPETTAQILNDIFNWTTTGLDAFNEVITLLDPAAGAPIQALITSIVAGMDQIKVDIQKYQSITPPPVGALAAIEDVLAIVASNFQAFLTSIDVSDSPLIMLVVGAITLILNTISGFINDLGNKATAALKAVAAKREFKLKNGDTVILVPKTLSIRAFKRTFNANMRSAGRPNNQLKLTLGEHLVPDWV